MRSQFQVREKSEKDLVTDADDAAQVEIARALHEAFPDHGFLGEEGSLGVSPQQLENNRSSPFCWVVDPLDGTTNYAHGLPQFAVSIALTYQDLPVVGVVLDPSSDECFSAARGLGARLNGESIHASRCKDLNQALIAASFPPKLTRESPEIEQFINMLLACQSLRRLGSAALNLCYVACGRLDGYWAGRLNSWDIAAGVLIVAEADGVITDLAGQTDYLRSGSVVASATEELHQQIKQLLYIGHD